MGMILKLLNNEIEWLQKEYNKSENIIKKLVDEDADIYKYLEFRKENKLLEGKLFQTIRIKDEVVKLEAQNEKI